jgi:ribonuclease Z
MTTTVVPLGTASAIPAHGRHLSACALERKGRVWLFDCGEGTQYQFARAGLKRSRIDGIFISHFHGDHLYGLMGLISTMALLHREERLAIVAPRGIRSIMETLPGVEPDLLPFDIDFVELDEGFGQATVFEDAEFTVTARPLEHRTFAMGFRFEERLRPGHLHPEQARALGVTDYVDFRRLKDGRPVTLDDGTTVEPEQVLGPERPGIAFAYVPDTRPCEGGRLLARGADLLYHEATFGEELQQRAIETGHSTAREAATVARDAEAERLLIGHFSARYDDPKVLAEQARAVFSNTDVAQELNRYALDPREKWAALGVEEMEKE